MSEENVNLIRSPYQAFERRDQTAVAAALDSGVEFRQTEELPWGGYYKGFPEGAHAFFSKLLAHIESCVEVERLWAAGDAVVVVGRTRGQTRTSEKPFDTSIVRISEDSWWQGSQLRALC
jgi:ketosteroid isomerase-like protein